MIPYCVFCSACLLFPFNYWKCLKVTNKKNNTIYEITPLPSLQRAGALYPYRYLYLFPKILYFTESCICGNNLCIFFFKDLLLIYKTGLPLCMWREQSKSNLIIKIFIRSTTSLIEKESVCILTPELKVPSPAIPQRGYI